MSIVTTKDLVSSNWVFSSVNAASTNSFNFLYGTGADGNVTIPFGITTLGKEMHYISLTINSGGILKPNGHRIHVKNTCNIISGGSINDNGFNSNGVLGAAGLGSRGYLVAVSGPGSSGSLGGTTGSVGGGSGGNAQPNDGNSQPNGSRGASTTSFSGGAGGGSAVQNPATSIRSPFNLLAGRSFVAGYNGGGGGGGGAGQFVGDIGGGGGAGGGAVWISAKILINNGTIQANGGAGANGLTGSATGSAGGGGGGGGGWVAAICGQSSTTGSILANGGVAGLSAGPGIVLSSLAGLSGTVVTYVVQ